MIVTQAEIESIKSCYGELDAVLDSFLPSDVVTKVRCAARDGFKMDSLPFGDHPDAGIFFSDNSSQTMDINQLDCSSFHFSGMEITQIAESISPDLSDVLMRLDENNVGHIYHASTTCSLLANLPAGRALSHGYYEWYLRLVGFSDKVKGNNCHNASDLDT